MDVSLLQEAKKPINNKAMKDFDNKLLIVVIVLNDLLEVIGKEYISRIIRVIRVITTYSGIIFALGINAAEIKNRDMVRVAL